MMSSKILAPFFRRNMKLLKRQKTTTRRRSRDSQVSMASLTNRIKCWKNAVTSNLATCWGRLVTGNAAMPCARRQDGHHRHYRLPPDCTFGLSICPIHYSH